MIKIIRQIILCGTSIFLLSSTYIFSGDLIDYFALIPKDVLEVFILPDLSLTDQTAFALTNKNNKEFVEQNYYLCTKQQYFQILRELFIEGVTKENALKKRACDLLQFVRYRNNPGEKVKIVKYNSGKFVTEVLKDGRDLNIINQIFTCDDGELLIILDPMIWYTLGSPDNTTQSKPIMDEKWDRLTCLGGKISDPHVLLLKMLKAFGGRVFNYSSGESFLFRDGDFSYRGVREDNALKFMETLLALDKIDFIVNVPNKSGYTPLAHYLFGCNNWYPENSAKVISLLLERGAIADLSDSKRTIFHYMCAQLHRREYIAHAYHCITYLPKELIIDLINKIDSQGNTALHIICAQVTTDEKILKAQEFIIKFFLDHGADLTIKNNQGETALALHEQAVHKMTKRIGRQLFINFDNLRNENFFPSFSFLLNPNFYRKIFEFLNDIRRYF